MQADNACCSNWSLAVYAQPVAGRMQAPSADFTQVLLDPILPGTGPLMQVSMQGKKRTRSALPVVLLTAMHAVVTLYPEVATICAPLSPSGGTQCKKLSSPYI